MRVLVAFAAVALCGCNLVAGLGDHALPDAGSGGTGPGGVPWYGAYAARKPITVHGNLLSAAQTAFQLPIAIAQDAGLAASAQAEGRDLFFTAADGVTPLTFDIELFAQETGRLVAWVRMPTLSNAETIIYLYYGQTDASPASDPAATWAGYDAVWHFGDDLGTSGLQDASGNALHSGLPSGAPVTRVAGMVGDAQQLDVGAEINVPQPQRQLEYDTASFTLSTWIRRDAIDPMAVGLECYVWNGATNTEAGYALTVRSDQEVRLEFSDGDLNTFVNPAAGNTVSLGAAWHHYAAVVDRSANRLIVYTDGMQAESATIGAIGPIENITSELSFGHNNCGVEATFDETRFIGSALSPERIAADFAVLDGTAVTLGAEELAP